MMRNIIFIIAIIILFIMYLSLIKPKLLYFIMIFLVGWHSVYIDIDLTITAYRLVIIIYLFCLPIYLLLRKDSIKFPRTTKCLLIFAFYAIILSLIARFYCQESYIASFSRGEGRLIFQIALLFINMTPAFLPLLTFKKIEDIKITAKVFIISTSVLCVLGWIQIIVLYMYKINLFPLFRRGITSQVYSIGMFHMFGVTFYRMNSLGGEPKVLGITIAVAIFVIVMSMFIDHKKFRIMDKKIFLLGFFIISLIMTFSGSGFMIAFMGLILFIILKLFIKELSIGFVFKTITSITIFIIILSVIVISSGILSLDSIRELFLARTFARSPIEDFDFAILKFLSTNLQNVFFGVGMGNIHLYARDYLPDYAIRYAYNNIFVAKSGYLRIISELGIIGFILFLWAYLAPIKFNFKYQKFVNDGKLKGIILSLDLFAIFILIAFLLRGYALNYIYITLGLIYFINLHGYRTIKETI